VRIVREIRNLLTNEKTETKGGEEVSLKSQKLIVADHEPEIGHVNSKFVFSFSIPKVGKLLI
jgi:hypothetical protein